MFGRYVRIILKSQHPLLPKQAYGYARPAEHRTAENSAKTAENKSLFQIQSAVPPAEELWNTRVNLRSFVRSAAASLNEKLLYFSTLEF